MKGATISNGIYFFAQYKEFGFQLKAYIEWAIYLFIFEKQEWAI